MSNVNPTGHNIRPSSPSQHSLRVNNRRYAFQPDGQSSWTPGLGSIMDNQLYDPSLNPPPTLTQHINRSVPSLPSQQPPQYTEHFEERPNHDPTASLEAFSALRLTDPVPRAASSLSVRSAQTSQSAQQMQHIPPTYRHVQQSYPSSSDGASLYSRDSRDSQNTFDVYGVDRFGPQEHGYISPDSLSPSSHFSTHSQHTWQTPQTGDYSPLYAAASNVLGMGPPSNSSSTSPSVAIHSPTGAAYSTRTTYSDAHAPIASHTSLNGPSGPVISRIPNDSNSSYHYSSDADDIESRPSLNRAGTSASVTLSTHKSKAIDLNAPPYTKEYIDQYRHRIKADPDPEAHFLYAKYLIDAAKKIRASEKDQRAAKKYSEILIGESLKVIRRLATQGEAYDEAQFFLANCYGTGALGLQVDHERAYHLYLQAAKQNHAAASYRVAVCNEIGAGTRREHPRAAAFYRKAASLGDTPAMYKLGMILLNGSLGEQKNPREAVNWLKRAAEQADEENPHALHELGMLYESPTSALVPYDPGYAKALFTQAAQLGYTQSQYKLGQCYEYGSLTCPIDPRRSIAWYTKAAEKGDAEAELALSGWYLTGSEGVLKQSDSEAYLWARRAANKGLSKAEYAVGYYAEVGIGIKQDIEFAKRWYMRAAAQGNKRAMNRLTEMKRMGGKRANVARPTRQQAKDECVIC